MTKLESTYIKFLRYLLPGGFQRVQVEGQNFKKLKLSSNTIYNKLATETLRNFIEKQQDNWIGHITRKSSVQKNGRPPNLA